MKIQVPIPYKDITITKDNFFVVTDYNTYFKVELPTPKHGWWVGEVYNTKEFKEITLIDVDAFLK